ncbi:DHBP synthase RibB-like alpha/beta domain-containing protein [Lipomyces arxii]|uniref:DHBP synthase RibB-like alpha/beta domain-containing protein n=1 Tax=Lipomyces arxii TaxID=56418 RepID=UPI0034CD70D4
MRISPFTAKATAILRMAEHSTVNTQILKVCIKDIAFPPDADYPAIPKDSNTYHNLNKASEILKAHTAPVAFPTETVYGLGASALSTTAVRQIFAAKNRPSDNPLIVHISSLDQLKRVLHTNIPAIYDPLVKKFWPGPLTIILPIPAPERTAELDGTVIEEPIISPACTPGQNTFGARMPSHLVARALIAISDTPLAAPSANASTKPSPTTAMHVFADMQGRIPLILDGGPCTVGVESTVVDGTVTPPAVLRPGGVSVEEIRQYGGPLWANVIFGKSEAGKDEKVRTPGMKYRHYSPRAKVVVFVAQGDGSTGVVRDYLTNVPEGVKVAVLPSQSFDLTAWNPALRAKVTAVKDLGKSGADIARNLFSHLREVDSLGVDLILVDGVNENNEGAAIMNRLRKAASELFENGQHIIKGA